jgi:hypothetical protein
MRQAMLVTGSNTPAMLGERCRAKWFPPVSRVSRWSLDTVRRRLVNEIFRPHSQTVVICRMQT